MTSLNDRFNNWCESSPLGISNGWFLMIGIAFGVPALIGLVFS